MLPDTQKVTVPTCDRCAKLGNKSSEDTRIKMSKSAMGNKNATIQNRYKLKIAKVDGRSTRSLDSYQKSTPEKRLQARIRHNVRGLINQKLKKRPFSKNRKSTFDILGYTSIDLMKHLESQFTEGMLWDNYGEWHIDHIIPDSWFNYTSLNDEDFKKSWNLNNLQPLWAAENHSKGDRYSGKYKENI